MFGADAFAVIAVAGLGEQAEVLRRIPSRWRVMLWLKDPFFEYEW